MIINGLKKNEFSKMPNFSGSVRKTYIPEKPETALEMTFDETIERLKLLISPQTIDDIFCGKEIKSPCSSKKNGDWISVSKIQGINPRAVGTYFDTVKYATTFPEDSIHLLPLFEQGCEKSLYSPINFKLSKEFLDKDLVRKGFDTPEKQLKLTVNLLHALGKNVGFDLLLHADRFSEEVFVNPDNFVWVQLNKDNTRELCYPEIHPDKTGEKVKKEVVEFLRENGDINGNKLSETLL